MNYEKYMKKCIKLARKGEGKTSPNPLVGCVVLDNAGNEIANGYHKAYGLAHAEADALNKLGDESIGGTLIVNLEPCNHHGKTPPCTDLIIKKGIKRLVIGMKDPNPKVSGNGAEKCKKAGIEVIEGILNKEALELNDVFIKNVTTGMPFVAIKTATTMDGKIATSTGDSKWITSENARNEVQKIRNRYDAILTTSSTVTKDNPSMNCRLKNGKNPIKIIIDRELKTDFNSKIYVPDGEKTYIVVDEKISISEAKIASIPTHVVAIKCETHNNKVNLPELLKKLYKLGICSILIEAGGKLNGEVVSLGLADKIYQFIAPKVLGDNTCISAFDGRSVKEISNTVNYKISGSKMFAPDILITYKKA